MLKLFSKSEINEAKSKDRHREVEEGVKLARKVDDLRALLASEEANLAKFRNETLSAISVELQEQQSKVDVLKNEVSDLTGKRNVLLEPLDAAWEAVKLSWRESGEREAELNLLQTTLSHREADVVVREAQIDSRTKGNIDTHEQALLTVQQASEALQRLSETQEKLTRYDEHLEERENDLSAKEANLSARIQKRENSLKEKEELLLEREEVVNSREKQIRDRERTHERNVNRLKGDKL